MGGETAIMDGGGYLALGVQVALTNLVTPARCMDEVLASGRASDTPDAPAWLKARSDMPGKWEIADGHHRVAQAIREGRTTVLGDLDLIPDDEPYEGPFFDFSATVR